MLKVKPTYLNALQENMIHTSINKQWAGILSLLVINCWCILDPNVAGTVSVIFNTNGFMNAKPRSLEVVINATIRIVNPFWLLLSVCYVKQKYSQAKK